MRAVAAQVVSCCVYDSLQKNLQYMHGNIPYLFDFCTDPFVHLGLLQSSMIQQLIKYMLHQNIQSLRGLEMNIE